MAKVTMGKSITAVADEMEIPKQTVSDWVKKADKDKSLSEEREKNKKKFVQNAWKIIGKTVKLANKRLDTALDDSDRLEKIMNAIDKEKNIEEKEKTRLLRTISKMEIVSFSELAKLLATFYDKQALIVGDNTANIGGIDSKLAEISDERLCEILNIRPKEDKEDE